MERLDHGSGRVDREAGILPEESAEADDCALVSLSTAGDERAFALLMRRYAPVVFGYLYGRTRDYEDAEDLFQEVFLTAYEELPRLRKPELFGPWLTRITRNKHIDFHRKKKTLARVEGKNSGKGPDWPAAQNDPSENAALNELRVLVRNTIGAMSDMYRTVLYMRLIAEEQPNVIARRLGLKESTVRMRLARGLTKLRKTLIQQDRHGALFGRADHPVS